MTFVAEMHDESQYNYGRRIVDHERNLELFIDNRPTGSSMLRAMKLVGKDFEYPFYMAGESYWPYYGIKDHDNSKPGYSKKNVRIIMPEPPKNAFGERIREYLTEAFLVYRSSWGLGLEGSTWEVVFEDLDARDQRRQGIFPNKKSVL